jgi:hypothetical protein
MLPPAVPLLLAALLPAGAVLGLFFLLLEQAARVVAAAAPPRPKSIDRRLTLATGPLDGSLSGMTPPRAVRRVTPLGKQTTETFFNAFDQNHSEQSVV